MEPITAKSRTGTLSLPSLPGAAPLPAAPAATSGAPTMPLGRAAGTAPLNDARSMRAIGTSRLSMDGVQMPGAAPTGAVAKLGATAAALGELGVVGALAEVAKAYTKSNFDPQAIGASLGKLADNLQQVAGQVHALPGVGDVLLGLGGLGAIASGVNGLREGIAAAKSAQDTPEKVQASLGAAAGAAKIVGGLATALTPFCPPLGAVGAAITAAGAAMDVGRVALENKAPLARALGTVQSRIFGLVPRDMQKAIDQASKIVSNNSSAMVRAPG